MSNRAFWTKIIALCTLVCWAAVQAGAAEGDWLTDFPKALSKAKAEKKLVLMDFTGSDWCPPCKALHKNVLTSPEFEAYARTNLVLVLVDFPNSKPQTEELKKANQQLSDKFKVEGLPTIVLLDGDGKELSKATGYNGEKPKEFIAKLEKARKKAS